MKKLICYKTRKTVTIEGELNPGGAEGAVWYTNQSGKLAKICKGTLLYKELYPKLDQRSKIGQNLKDKEQELNDKIEKLKVMVDYLPTAPYQSKSHISFIWPESLLKYGDEIVGFLMPEIKDAKEIFNAYNQKQRDELFPHFSYYHLHKIAFNLAKIFQEVHKHKIVIGDVKQRNFLVNNNAEVTLIDIDSIQIYDRKGKCYRCTVGTPEYDPPELRNYKEERKPEHDLYGLGMLIYQLLMGGRPPFPEQNGRQFYAYEHPPKALPFETLHPKVRKLMKRFLDYGYKNPQERPSAEHWVLALQEAKQSLKRCSNNERHYYQQHLQKCIWCERAWELKRDAFPPMSGYKHYNPTKTSPPPIPRPISTPQRNIPIPSSSKILVPNNKTRRQILRLGGLAGSGLVAAALTRDLWEQLLPSPTPPPQPKIPIQTFTTVRVNSRGGIISRSEGKAEVITENIGHGVYLEMVKIPGGRFLMGSPETEASRYDGEDPQHYVNVPEFFMGKYTVTQAQWEAVMVNHPSRFQRKNRPVVRVSWYDATKFCQKLSKKTGRHYRLPSEAEWEYACRAGTKTPFYFGETITSELVNFRGYKNYADERKGKYRKKRTDVGIFPPNSFGLYDMHGNVWEFCQDVWHSNYYGAPVDGSAWVNGGDRSRRVCRGGSWFNFPRRCRSANRASYWVGVDHSYWRYNTERTSYLVGFRLVSVPPQDS